MSPADASAFGFLAGLVLGPWFWWLLKRAFGPRTTVERDA